MYTSFTMKLATSIAVLAVEGTVLIHALVVFIMYGQMLKLREFPYFTRIVTHSSEWSNTHLANRV